MLRILVTLTALVALSTATHVVYKDCGSTGTVKYVDLEPCESQPCSFKQGTNASVNIDFMAKSAAQEVKAVVYGIIAGVPVPFPIPDPDACKSNVKCPVKAGDENLYKNSLQVLPSYPTIKVVVQYELRDENGNKMVCVLFPLQIVHA